MRLGVRMVLGAAAAALLAACSGPAADKSAGKEGGAPADAGVVNLYTARHYDSDTQIYEAFTKKTGIKVRRIEAPGPQLIERMKAEGDASPADVLVVADGGVMGLAAEAGLLQPNPSAEVKRLVDGHLRDERDLWAAVSRRARVIAYDSTKVKPEEVDTYEELASPRFKGKLCVRNADNPYNLSLLSALIERWGPEKALTWAKAVVANMARAPQGGDIDQIKAVGAGQCEVAITNSYYYLRLVANGDEVTKKVLLAWPSIDGRGAHVNVSGAGIAKNAPNRDNAVKFIEFMLSPEAQAIFANVTNEFPVVKGTRMPERVAAFADRPADPLPVSRYGARQGEAQRVFEEAGWR